QPEEGESSLDMRRGYSICPKDPYGEWQAKLRHHRFAVYLDCYYIWTNE
ncbi:MAG: hypothetical protein HW407_1436, partial [Bacteroidetes bacterium]|nr:hypothetical protein [Bacteroidota bacterium]